MKYIINSLIVVGLVFTGNAMADDHAGYGSAGCGLGSVIIGGGAGFKQVFAATTNGTSGNQTFGISSGTLNCGASHSKKGVANYIESNRDAFSKDAARGNGETIAALSELAGCNDAASVGNVLQQRYQTIFSSDAVSSEAVIKQVIETLQTTETLACGNLG